MTITGSAESGKTSMLINVLTLAQIYKKVFHAVNCIIPAHGVASLKNIYSPSTLAHTTI